MKKSCVSIIPYLPSLLWVYRHHFHWGNPKIQNFAGTAQVSMVPSEVLINCCLPMDHNPPLMTWLGMGLHTSGASTIQCLLLVARHCQKFLHSRIYEVSGREEFLRRSKDIFDWVANHIVQNSISWSVFLIYVHCIAMQGQVLMWVH